MARSEGYRRLFRLVGEKLRLEMERRVSAVLPGPRFHCPLCDFRGPFLTSKGQKQCLCPRCGARPRHRLMRLVLGQLLANRQQDSLTVLHFAPFPPTQRWLRPQARLYVSADLAQNYYAESYVHKLDAQCDLRRLPFPDATFDLILCVHVLEHVREDDLAIAEIWRVLAEDGIALLPVPILAGPNTIEFARPRRPGAHVRAPGLDYFERFRAAGFEVEVRTSADFPRESQLYLYGDRSRWPKTKDPRFPVQRGLWHMAYMPVCRKRAKSTSRLSPDLPAARRQPQGSSGF